MNVVLLSDLHCEVVPFELPSHETDKDDILVLAGDIGVVKYPESFACVKPWIARFKHTIMIAGNHEFYGESLLCAFTKQKEIFSEELKTGKLSIINNETIRVDNLSFICATLWTDYNRDNPVIMQTVRDALNDYRLIRTGSYNEPYFRRINPLDLHKEHTISKEFIFKSIEEEKYIDGQKIVVVTHQGPSTKSLHPKYAGDPVNWGFVSDLEQQIIDTNPDFWLHGHVHDSFDYMIENTRVVVNPRGYARKVKPRDGGPLELINENSAFNPTLRIKI